jgi:hypothetical protein
MHAVFENLMLTGTWYVPVKASTVGTKYETNWFFPVGLPFMKSMHLWALTDGHRIGKVA